MKTKISLKLTLCFLGVALALMTLTSSAFLGFFRSLTIDLYKKQMTDRAQNIANGISKMLDAPILDDGRIAKIGPAAFLGFMSSDDVWLVTANGEIIMSARAESAPMPGKIRPDSFKQLSEGMEKVIDRSLSGETTYTENFSSLFGNPTVTVGVPVVARARGVVAALLLHAEVKSAEEAYRKSALLLLFCILAGLSIAAGVSYAVSLSITRPVKKMNATALRLAAGDYTAKSNIKSDDEIGELGTSIDELADRLDEAQKESVHLEQLRRDFVGNVSHELRTPLTIIRGCTESLIDGVYTKKEDVKNQYTKIIAESRTLERLVRDLLDLSKLQNMKFQIASEPVEMTSVVNDAVSAMNVVAKSKEVSIEADLCRPPVMFSGDYDRVKQLVVIILDNAIKFSPAGGKVSVTQKLKDGNCFITIKDCGEGISEESLPYIFDRFYKTDVSHNGAGTGLGLAIAKEIANKMNIDIRVTSKPGAGTTFELTLPVEKEQSV